MAPKKKGTPRESAKQKDSTNKAPVVPEEGELMPVLELEDPLRSPRGQNGPPSNILQGITPLFDKNFKIPKKVNRAEHGVSRSRSRSPPKVLENRLSTTPRGGLQDGRRGRHTSRTKVVEKVNDQEFANEEDFESPPRRKYRR